VHGLPEAPDLSEYDRVTVAWLQYHQAVAHRVDEMRKDPVAGENVRALFDVLSEDIIDSHLGHGWFAEHVNGSASSDQTRNYLRFDGPPAVRLLPAQRVHDLARRLYELQSFPWFDDAVRRVRTRDLSGAGFELDVAFLLHHLVAGVTPKEEAGKKGEDYDIHLQVFGLDVPVEAKAKDDDTPYNEKTVINTVKGAASQLPQRVEGNRVHAHPQRVGRHRPRRDLSRCACGIHTPDQPRRSGGHRDRQDGPERRRDGGAGDEADASA
jgi:hypothetical protein